MKLSNYKKATTKEKLVALPVVERIKSEKEWSK